MNSASSDLGRHLGVLLERLQHPTAFETAFHYFIEEFGGDTEFIAMGVPETPASLTRVMEAAARKILLKPVRLERLSISVVPGHGFHHGSARVDGRAVVVMFFEVANTGLMTIIPGVHGAAECARFSLADGIPIVPGAN